MTAPDSPRADDWDRLCTLADAHLTRAESAEAERDDLRARLAAIEALADRTDQRVDIAHRLVTTTALRAVLASPSSLAQWDAEVGARALREAASDLVADCSNQPGPCICVAREWLRARADSLATEGES